MPDKPMVGISTGRIDVGPTPVAGGVGVVGLVGSVGSVTVKAKTAEGDSSMPSTRMVAMIE